MTTKRLGRGLADIIPAAPIPPPMPTELPATVAAVEVEGKPAANLVLLPTAQIRVGRFQPRQEIVEHELEELKASIKRQGVIEPVLVRPIAHGVFELVAGERRLRASQAIGIQQIPSIIKSLSDKEALEYSLIENVQRENLNPMEEARGYLRLIEEFGYTQEDVAAAVGKDRATVANLLRLIKLPEAIQQAIRDGVITAGHAKVLLGAEGGAKQMELFQAAVKRQLSVRQLEELVGQWTPGRKRRARRAEPQLTALEDAIRQRLGTKVRLVARHKGGRLVIEYFSPEDLERILQALGLSGGG